MFVSKLFKILIFVRQFLINQQIVHVQMFSHVHKAYELINY